MRTHWPGSKGPNPPVSGRNQTPRWHLPVAPCPPRAPWPSAQDSGQERLHSPFRLSPGSCALRSAWRTPLPASFPVPPWGQRLAPFWLSPGLPDSQKVLCFRSSGLPPPSLRAQCPWRRWGIALCGSLSGSRGGFLDVSHFVYTAGWKVDTMSPFCRCGS